MGKEIATQVQETQRVPKRIKPRQNTQFNSVQLLSRVQLFATPWTAARQASLSITNSWSLLRLISIESVMPSNHLIFGHPLLLLPSVFPSIRVFSNESSLRASLVAQLVKNLPAMRGTWLQSLGWEDPLEKEKATHSSIMAWRIP